VLRPHLSGPAAVALVALVAACGGTEETPAPAPVTYAAVQAVLTRACAFSSCHFTMARAGAGLRLGEGDSYAALVRVPSTQVPRLMRVQPGFFNYFKCNNWCNFNLFKRFTIRW
jgi:hypothetical protein